jgi:hypothetical protein
MKFSHECYDYLQPVGAKPMKPNALPKPNFLHRSDSQSISKSSIDRTHAILRSVARWGTTRGYYFYARRIRSIAKAIAHHTTNILLCNVLISTKDHTPHETRPDSLTKVNTLKVSSALGNVFSMTSAFSVERPSTPDHAVHEMRPDGRMKPNTPRSPSVTLSVFVRDHVLRWLQSIEHDTKKAMQELIIYKQCYFFLSTTFPIERCIIEITRAAVSFSNYSMSSLIKTNHPSMMHWLKFHVTESRGHQA